MRKDYPPIPTTGLTVDEILWAIRVWAIGRGVTVHGLANSAGLAAGTLRNVHDEDWNPRAQTLRALEKYILKVEGWTGGLASYATALLKEPPAITVAVRRAKRARRST